MYKRVERPRVYHLPDDDIVSFVIYACVCGFFFLGCTREMESGFRACVHGLFFNIGFLLIYGQFNEISISFG